MVGVAGPRISKKILREHFWSHVLGTAAIRIGDLVLLNVGLGKAKVRNLDSAADVKQDVFELDVSKEDAILVQVLKALQDLEKNIFGRLLAQAFHLLHVVIQVAARAVLQAEHDVILCLEGVIQVNQVFVFYRKQDALLVL